MNEALFLCLRLPLSIIGIPHLTPHFPRVVIGTIVHHYRNLHSKRAATVAFRRVTKSDLI